MSFGSRIEELRKLNGWNQQQLADKIEVSRQTIVGYESELKEISIINTLIKLSEVFNTSVDYVLDLTDQKERYPAPETIADLNREIIDLPINDRRKIERLVRELKNRGGEQT